MLNRSYLEQIRAALIVIAGSGFLVLMGWLTGSERHGLPGLTLWAFCYGLPAVVLALWCRPYVAALACGFRSRKRKTARPDLSASELAGHTP
jgi:hypothetical protein